MDISAALSVLSAVSAVSALSVAQAVAQIMEVMKTREAIEATKTIDGYIEFIIRVPGTKMMEAIKTMEALIDFLTRNPRSSSIFIAEKGLSTLESLASMMSDSMGCSADLVVKMKESIRTLKMHWIWLWSQVSKNCRQPHNDLEERVNGIHQGRTSIITTRKELPMIIGGKEIKAQHDSGAERGNFMDCILASKLNLRLRTEKGDCKRFCMGNGTIVKALGRVRAICAFAKEAQTKMKCWFYVFDELASPLIMGSQFLEKTKTLSDYVHRLEDSIPNSSIVPMVNLIGSSQQAKRRFAAHIDHRLTLINADSGSDLDLMSSTYVRAHGYRLDRRRRCRKRVRFADNTKAETIGQVNATLTLEDGSMYSKTFDVLPKLTSDVLLGQFTLEEIKAFQIHRSSFVDVFAGERHLELSVLGYLGKVNEFLACKLRRIHRRRSLRQNQGKLFQYHLKRLRFATNPWISIACETAG